MKNKIVAILIASLVLAGGLSSCRSTCDCPAYSKLEAQPQVDTYTLQNASQITKPTCKG